MGCSANCIHINKFIPFIKLCKSSCKYVRRAADFIYMLPENKFTAKRKETKEMDKIVGSRVLNCWFSSLPEWYINVCSPFFEFMSKHVCILSYFLLLLSLLLRAFFVVVVDWKLYFEFTGNIAISISLRCCSAEYIIIVRMHLQHQRR